MKVVAGRKGHLAAIRVDTSAKNRPMNRLAVVSAIIHSCPALYILEFLDNYGTSEQVS